jgi:hypothetical protein
MRYYASGDNAWGNRRYLRRRSNKYWRNDETARHQMVDMRDYLSCADFHFPAANNKPGYCSSCRAASVTCCHTPDALSLS